ncbi:MAG: hypothetical protein K1000chlam3_01022 [Chlamydiae bacterium]|nr:hypothetical protein [Chlamydiota bacterium]
MASSVNRNGGERSVIDNGAERAGAVIDHVAPSAVAVFPQARTAAVVLAVANTALAAGGHRTTGIWVAEDSHRSPGEWMV